MGWLFNGKGAAHNPRRCGKNRCREQRCKDYRDGYSDGNQAGAAMVAQARQEAYQEGLNDGAAMAAQ